MTEAENDRDPIQASLDGLEAAEQLGSSDLLVIARDAELIEVRSRLADLLAKVDAELAARVA